MGKLNNKFKILHKTKLFSAKCMPILCHPKEDSEVWRRVKATCNKIFLHSDEKKIINFSLKLLQCHFVCIPVLFSTGNQKYIFTRVFLGNSCIIHIFFCIREHVYSCRYALLVKEKEMCQKLVVQINIYTNSYN